MSNDLVGVEIKQVCEDELQCVICLALPRPVKPEPIFKISPLAACDKGMHIVCSSCLRFMKTGHCPLCKKDSKGWLDIYSGNRILRNIYQKLLSRTEFDCAREGCKVTGLKGHEQVQAHDALCDYNKRPICIFDGQHFTLDTLANDSDHSDHLVILSPEKPKYSQTFWSFTLPFKDGMEVDSVAFVVDVTEGDPSKASIYLPNVAVFYVHKTTEGDKETYTLRARWLEGKSHISRRNLQVNQPFEMSFGSWDMTTFAQTILKPDYQGRQSSEQQPVTRTVRRTKPFNPFVKLTVDELEIDVPPNHTKHWSFCDFCDDRKNFHLHFDVQLQDI